MPKGDLMNCTTPKKRKAAQTIIASLFIFSILAGMLSSCNAIAKTPTSPEGTGYDLTPTVEDPATQELTLVLETEVATVTPTWTLTPEPSPTATATATETPTPTEVEKYPIDLEKLSTTPESYQYLLDHRDEFVRGPDPLEVGMEEFFKWYLGKLMPSLGDYKEREGNLYYNKLAVGEERLAMTDYNLDRSIKGQMEFWYFEHGGVVYPVVEVQGLRTSDGTPFKSVGIVLVEQLGNQEMRVIKDIYDRQKEFIGLTIFVIDNEKMPVSEDVHRMFEEGIFYNDPEGMHFFGIGSIGFR
jgi:hypothetical protein